jgi:hypothetical protein
MSDQRWPHRIVAAPRFQTTNPPSNRRIGAVNLRLTARKDAW